jgi:GT2 family glycosyltransferase
LPPSGLGGSIWFVLPPTSAPQGGYKKAIAQALADGADYIWLMDDDNAPISGCAELLWQELQKLSSEVGKSNAAVGGIRSEVLDVRRAYLKPATFMHFHVADLCYILLKRLRKGNNVSLVFPSQVEVPFWANGGMMLSREVYEKHGLPRDDFVMYGEDFEFTLRFTRGGGVIRLFKSAKVVDLEPSWASGQKNGFFYHPCIHAGSDFRIYYGVRNEVYIDRFFYKGNCIIYWINKLVYLGGLFFIALLSRKLARFGLILKAVADGEHGRLGARDEFVLP